jgi:hypothetical protein
MARDSDSDSDADAVTIPYLTVRTLQRQEQLLKNLETDSRWIKWSAIITLGLTVVLAFLTAVLAFIAYHDYIIRPAPP